jgi:TetR/AcrR family transcriptional regulator, transcriptional repressor for nem operon
MSTTTREHILACGAGSSITRVSTPPVCRKFSRRPGCPRVRSIFISRARKSSASHWWIITRVVCRAGAADSQGCLTAAIVGWLDFFCGFDSISQEGFIKGCPIGNLIQELGDVNPAFRDKLHASLDGLIRFVTKLLEEAQERRSTPRTPNRPKTRRGLSSPPGRDL